MRALVTIQQASDHLRRDDDTDRADLQLKVDAASEIVLHYLKEVDWLDEDAQVVPDDQGKPFGVPEQVKMATLYLVDLMYNSGTAEQIEMWQSGYPPAPVMAMLYPLRDPALA